MSDFNLIHKDLLEYEIEKDMENDLAYFKKFVDEKKLLDICKNYLNRYFDILNLINIETETIDLIDDIY